MTRESDASESDAPKRDAQSDADSPSQIPEVPDAVETPILPGPGVFLWSAGSGSLADPLTLEGLAGVHPLWAEDARAFAPWQEVFAGGGAAGSQSWRRSGRHAGSRVVVCGPCSSSLDVARRFVENDLLAPWDSALAVSQRSGRGQLGRSWSSPAGNIYGTLCLPPVPKEFDNILSLIMGYCLARFLRAKNVPACIKWPNDILVRDVKVAGVLIEEREGRCVAGMGLNLVSAPAAGELRADHGAPAGSLREIAEFSGSPLGTWCDLVDFVRVCYENTIAREVGDVTARLIEPLLCWLGREVTIREAGEASGSGRILGLAKDGALRVMPCGKTREKRLTSGAVRRA